MLVLQQINVLPAGAEIYIYDNDKMVITCKKSNFDGTLLFSSIKESELYYKVYSTFKCYELKARAYTNNINVCTDLDAYKIHYLIQIRGESDEG